MKMYKSSGSTVTVTLLLAAIGSNGFGQVATKVAATKGPANAFLNIPAAPEVAIPQSIFATPSQPSEGRNPFFPLSTPVQVVPKLTPQNPVDLASFFVLNGITSPPKRTAMINGRTFEAGEQGEVRLPSGGKMMIKCLEIKADSAVIEVDGQRRDLRLRSGI